MFSTNYQTRGLVWTVWRVKSVNWTDRNEINMLMAFPTCCLLPKVDHRLVKIQKRRIEHVWEVLDIYRGTTPCACMELSAPPNICVVDVSLLRTHWTNTLSLRSFFVNQTLILFYSFFFIFNNFFSAHCHLCMYFLMRYSLPFLHWCNFNYLLS